VSKWDDKSAAFCWGMEVGETAERKRVLDLIAAMNKHTTHSELCLKMHWFAEKLTAQIEADN
jgi:hypothetical protein